MKLSLETLKATKGKVKEFSFLTPVSEYITKHYDEIVDELDGSHIREIFGEIGKDHEIKSCLAVYDKPDSFSLYGSYNFDISADPKVEGLSKFECRAGWSDKTNLTEIYYISDIAGYDAYLEEEKVKATEKRFEEEAARLEKKRVEEKERQAKVLVDAALRAEFDLERGADTTKAAIFKAIFDEKADKATRYKEFLKLADLQEFDRSDIEEIALDCAREAVSDHYYDEH